MNDFLKYFKDYKIESILAPLLKMFEATFELFVPIVIAKLIDVGIKTNNFSYSLKCFAILIILSLVGLLISVIAQYFSAKTATNVASLIRRDFFIKVQTLSNEQLDKIGTSTLITRLNSDINLTQNGINMVLRLFLRSPFVVFGCAFMSLLIDFKLSLIFLVMVIILSIIVVLIMNLTTPKYREIQDCLDDLTVKTRDNINGVRVLRSFNGESLEALHFEKLNNSLLHKQSIVSKISSLMNPLTVLIVNLSICSLLYFGYLRIESNSISTGQLIALYNYMGQILIELVKFANLVVIVGKGWASTKRVMNIINIKDVNNNYTELDLTKDFDNSIVFKNVSFKYPDAGDYCLNNISFKLCKGETLGIIGPTGSGKSTLVQLLCGSYKTQIGKVLLFGNDLMSINQSSIYNHISIANQKPALFKGTIRDNIIMQSLTSDDKIDKLLHISELYSEIYDKDGLETKVLQNGINFSGGQKQRLCIARTLNTNKEIIIFDDSFSALDNVTERKVLNNIFANKNNENMIIVSQKCSTIINADKILVLEDGKCVGYGDHNYLIENCDLYKEIYQSQYSESEVD